jgi:uncharacterized protein
MSLAHESKTSKSLNVIFKVTERCNLACKYCYFFFGGDESYKGRPPVVEDRVIEGLSRFLATGEELGIEQVNIIFHGGEPMLMPKQRFSAMCGRLRDSLGRRVKLHFGIQTNCMLVDDDWIDICSEFSISVGVSLDGPAHVNDLNRVDRKGRGTHAKIIANWFRLLEAAAVNKIRPPGLLCVMNPAVDGAAIYRHFVDDLHATWMDFLLPDVTPSLGMRKLVEGVEKYMMEVFREWAADLDENVVVRFIKEVFAPLANDDAARSMERKNIDYRGLISVSSNGEVGPHDVLRTLNGKWAKSEINVLQHDIRDLFASRAWHELGVAAELFPQECSDCAWWRLCRGGSLEHRLGPTGSDFGRKTIYCSALQELYSEVAAHLAQGGIAVSDIERRLGIGG